MSGQKVCYCLAHVYSTPYTLQYWLLLRDVIYGLFMLMDLDMVPRESRATAPFPAPKSHAAGGARRRPCRVLRVLLIDEVDPFPTLVSSEDTASLFGAVPASRLPIAYCPPPPASPIAYCPPPPAFL